MNTNKCEVRLVLSTTIETGVIEILQKYTYVHGWRSKKVVREIIEKCWQVTRSKFWLRESSKKNCSPGKCKLTQSGGENKCFVVDQLQDRLSITVLQLCVEEKKVRSLGLHLNKKFKTNQSYRIEGQTLHLGDNRKTNRGTNHETVK